MFSQSQFAHFSYAVCMCSVRSLDKSCVSYRIAKLVNRFLIIGIAMKPRAHISITLMELD